MKQKKQSWRWGIGVLIAILLLFVLALPFGLFEKLQKKEYPLAYRAEILTAAEAFHLPPELLFAVVHTESGFDAQAVSEVGARGLTQIMPETFLWLQKKDGKKELELLPQEALFEPEVSLYYGAMFYEILLEKYDGDVKTAAAAYHSGTGQVQKWLSNPQYSKDGKTLSQIPGKNAAHYADKILKAMEKYKKLYEKEI